MATPLLAQRYQSFFLTINPYEWTFPWPSFIEDVKQERSLHPTDISVLETLHVAHVLEQIARGYLFGGNNRPANKNVITYVYRFVFQQKGTLHLHMLVWVKDVAVIQSDLLQASVPRENHNNTFLVARHPKLRLFTSRNSFWSKLN